MTTNEMPGVIYAVQGNCVLHKDITATRHKNNLFEAVPYDNRSSLLEAIEGMKEPVTVCCNARNQALDEVKRMIEGRE